MIEESGTNNDDLINSDIDSTSTKQNFISESDLNSESYDFLKEFCTKGSKTQFFVSLSYMVFLMIIFRVFGNFPTFAILLIAGSFQDPCKDPRNKK